MSARLCFSFVLCFSLFDGPFARAQPEVKGNPFEQTNAEQVANWKMEVLHRKDGKRIFGLIGKEREDEIEFVEVALVPGKQLYLVIHFYDPRFVTKLTRLEKTERQELLKRIQPLLEKKSHARIEGGRMEDVNLTRITRDGTRYHGYVGNMFTLLSTADEETTRRCAVRIEQIFHGFRQVLPPRQQRTDELVVLLLGSMDEYRGELHRRNLRVTNPAFFFAEKNLIVAGSELTRFSAHLHRLRQLGERRRREYESLDKGFPARLTELAAEMKRKGFPPSEIKSEATARKARWERDYHAALKKIAEVNRRNERKFLDVTNQMFTRLYHESFHAYLENLVFPHDQFDVPSWLNEGLAQVFESGQLYNGHLRIAAPNRALLHRLQADLKNGQPMHLSDLLSSRNATFLLTHDDAKVSGRHYLYAWGLAYYLTFHQNVLGSKALDRYVSRGEGKLPPVERFEKLVGMPIAAFEHKWRAAMLELIPAPK